MADEDGPNPISPTPRRRHPATIDLTATAVELTPARPDDLASRSAQGGPTESAAPPPESAVPHSESHATESALDTPDVVPPPVEADASRDAAAAIAPSHPEAPGIAPHAASQDDVAPQDSAAMPPDADQPIPAPDPHRRGFWPLVGAGLTGGAVVAALMGALWLLGLVRLGNADADLSVRLGLIEARLGAIGSSADGPPGLDALSSRVEKLEGAAETPRATASPDAGTAARVSAAETALKTVADGIVNLDRRAQTMAGDLRTTRERADAAVKAVADIDKAGRPGGVERGDLDAVAAEVAALDAVAKGLQDDAARRAALSPADRAARVALLATVLRAAVDRGDVYAPELTALKSLLPDAAGLAPLDAFATVGVPSAAVLSREASAIAAAMLRENREAAPDGSFLAKLQANAERLVRIRPVEAAGSDVSSIVARAENRSAQNDVPGTLAEFAKLPDDKRAPAESWIKRAQARMSAIDAARKLAADGAAALAAQAAR